MNSIQIRVQGTEDQFRQMTGQCELTEALFAQTLARRIEGMTPEESIPFILSWFQSVRHMSQAMLMGSGIKTSVEPLGKDTASAEHGGVVSAADKAKRMDQMVRLLAEFGVQPTDAQMERIWHWVDEP